MIIILHISFPCRPNSLRSLAQGMNANLYIAGEKKEKTTEKLRESDENPAEKMLA